MAAGLGAGAGAGAGADSATATTGGTADFLSKTTARAPDALTPASTFGANGAGPTRSNWTWGFPSSTNELIVTFEIVPVVPRAGRGGSSPAAATVSERSTTTRFPSSLE